MIKTYREAIRLKSFEDRYEYLKIGGAIGSETFGFERYLNQNFYNSPEWQATRRDIIVRDNGCDLAIPDLEIIRFVVVHHINPITIEDIEYGRDCVFDPENLICSSRNTHSALHFANKSMLSYLPKERTRGDMCPWLT